MAGDADRNDAELRARLDALAGRLSERKDAVDPAAGDKPVDGAIGQAMSQGMRAMGEFVGAVGVSAVIGWQLDEWLHTAPVLLLVFLALGTCAGFWTIYRMAAKPTSGSKSK